MTPLRVLITNIVLSGRSGTETVARDVAIGLVRRGHLPVVYSPQLSIPGQDGVAREIREALVPVIDDLKTLTQPPDIIHGNHLHETITACLEFPNTPAVWVCHSWDGPHDKAPNFPTIKKFLAVDESCLERLICEEGIPREKTDLLLNCVNLSRFKQRVDLPTKPRKALVFSHYAAHSVWFKTVQEACEKYGLELDAVGQGLGELTSAPEQLLLKYDVVFAIDRSAIEACAAGAAVILCGQPGLGPMVTNEICAELLVQNFGRKWLNESITVENVIERLNDYNPSSAARASQTIRDLADSDKYMTKLVGIYQQVINEQGATREHTEEQLDTLKCASNYCRQLSAAVRTHIFGNNGHMQDKIARDGLTETAERRRLRLIDVERARSEAVVQQEDLRAKLLEAEANFLKQKESNQFLQAEVNQLKANFDCVSVELNKLRSSRTIIIKNRIFKTLGYKP